MKHKKTKSYWVEDTPEKLDYINQTLYEENMKLNKELAKYKRAFEILEDNHWINDLIADGKCFGKCIHFKGISSYNKPKEYELLEELMKND